MPSVLLWACLAENLFLFAAQKNLRIFLSCFFTGRGRDGKRHLLLSACGRRAATSDWRSLKKRLRDLHAEQAGISSFLGWSLLLWDYQPPPTRIRSAQETMRKKASRPRHARMLGAATRGTKKEPTGLIAYPAAHRRPVSGCGSQRMLHALKRRSHPADHGPSFASLFPPLAAVSSAAIPVRVKLKTPLRNAQRQQPH